jgi:predicted dinucleotide-binding enzyme
MKIGIIGTGRMGSTLGRLWAAKGHAVCFGSRNPDKAIQLATSISANATGGSYREATTFGEVLLLATQWAGVAEALAEIGALMDDKVLLDCTLPIVDRNPAVDGNSSGAQEIARQVPQAKVVKVFNTIDYRHFGNSPFGNTPLSAYCSSDDETAKQIAARLAHDIGLEPIDTGPLWMAKYLEGLGFLILYCAYGSGYGIDISFKLLQADSEHKANWWQEAKV